MIYVTFWNLSILEKHNIVNSLQYNLDKFIFFNIYENSHKKILIGWVFFYIGVYSSVLDYMLYKF